MNERKRIWPIRTASPFNHGDNQPNLNVPWRIGSLEVVRKLNKIWVTNKILYHFEPTIL
jgi:hypothetical protein